MTSSFLCFSFLHLIDDHLGVHTQSSHAVRSRLSLREDEKLRRCVPSSLLPFPVLPFSLLPFSLLPFTLPFFPSSFFPSLLSSSLPSSLPSPISSFHLFPLHSLPSFPSLQCQDRRKRERWKEKRNDEKGSKRREREKVAKESKKREEWNKRRREVRKRRKGRDQNASTSHTASVGVYPSEKIVSTIS